MYNVIIICWRHSQIKQTQLSVSGQGQHDSIVDHPVFFRAWERCSSLDIPVHFWILCRPSHPHWPWWWWLPELCVCGHSSVRCRVSLNIVLSAHCSYDWDTLTLLCIKHSLCFPASLDLHLFQCCFPSFSFVFFFISPAVDPASPFHFRALWTLCSPSPVARLVERAVAGVTAVWADAPQHSLYPATLANKSVPMLVPLPLAFRLLHALPWIWTWLNSSCHPGSLFRVVFSDSPSKFHRPPHPPAPLWPITLL